MNLTDVKNFLQKHIAEEGEKYFGITNPTWIDSVVNNWFNDNNNYDGRWEIIREKVPTVGKVLDMAAGCGTFILYGLQKGYDVWGIEPEKWKNEYYKRKVIASNYPLEYLDHLITGIGEALPFQNDSFDFITTYQTLEHVQDVNSCLQELLRVLKPGGILYIRAPDYNCFFEPHYRVPFLPKMNKKLAASYLELIGKPILGLQTLQWVTEKWITDVLKNSKYNVHIERMSQYYFARRQKKIEERLPSSLKNRHVIHFVNSAYGITANLRKLFTVGRAENNIDLWVTKLT